MHFSEIVPIDKTRGFAVHPAVGLRFGNFDGATHLPPVKNGSSLGPHSFATLNNQQIYRTVCDWVQSWQPWQQNVMLCSIVNRFSLPQLQMLVTTLEPLRHRNPLTGSRHKTASSQVLDVANVKDTPTLNRTLTTFPQISIVKQPAGRTKSSEILQARTKGEKKREENGQDKRSFGSPRVKCNNTQSSCESLAIRKEEEKPRPRLLDLDSYASIVSSSVLVAAFGEIALTHRQDAVMEQEQSKLTPENSHAVGRENVTDNTRNLTTIQSASKGANRGIDDLPSIVRNAEIAVINLSQPVTSVLVNTSGILRSSSGKRVDRSRSVSTLFLGSQISYSGLQSRLQSRNGSSRYRYNMFSSSVASTSDFFLRDRISLLGPMKRSIVSGDQRKPLAVGNIPVPMQRFYKNRGWWPKDTSDYMHLQPAHKQELSSNFHDQLAAINEWQQHWEGYERLSLLKEVVKLCSGDVLAALLNYIYQKLRDVYDINRLPDKLLLYVLSYLPPSDVLKAAQVCRRWHYLCAFDNLWIVKCLELGEEEGINNIPQLIESANTGHNSVDWQLAYVELHKLVDNMKKADLQLITAESGSPQIRSSKQFRTKRLIEREGCDKETESKSTTASANSTACSESGEKIDDKAKDSDVVSQAKDLPPFVQDSFDLIQPEISGNFPKMSKRQRKSLKSSLKHPTGDILNRTIRSSKSGRSGRGSRSVMEEKQEETALDILTDLSQSTDLLGKIIPSMSLEWQTPQHNQDLVRFPVYAGKVVIVQKVRKVTGHSGGVRCLQFDRRRLVTGGADRSVWLWDVRSGRPIHKFFGHKVVDYFIFWFCGF